MFNKFTLARNSACGAHVVDTILIYQDGVNSKMVELIRKKNIIVEKSKFIV